MKKLTSIVLAIVFTLSITLAVVNSSLSTINKDSKRQYSAVTGAGGWPTGSPSERPTGESSGGSTSGPGNNQ